MVSNAIFLILGYDPNEGIVIVYAMLLLTLICVSFNDKVVISSGISIITGTKKKQNS